MAPVGDRVYPPQFTYGSTHRSSQTGSTHRRALRGCVHVTTLAGSVSRWRIRYGGGGLVFVALFFEIVSAPVPLLPFLLVVRCRRRKLRKPQRKRS